MQEKANAQAVGNNARRWGLLLPIPVGTINRRLAQQVRNNPSVTECKVVKQWDVYAELPDEISALSPELWPLGKPTAAIFVHLRSLKECGYVPHRLVCH